MEKLQAHLNELLARLDNESEVKARLETLVSVYPFNEFEYIISTLLSTGVLSLQSYQEIRIEYISRNKNRSLYEISSPTGFGITWAQEHIQELVPQLTKPPKGARHFDFVLDGSIRLEVKASRAVAYKTKGKLYEKALTSGSPKQFDMNFQQMKPRHCEVFLWIGVWLDVIRYWVLSSEDVESNRYYSAGQHEGNVGEGQLHMNRDNLPEFKKYEAQPSELAVAIRNAQQRQNGK